MSARTREPRKSGPGAVSGRERVRRAYDAMASVYHQHLPDLRAEQPVDRAMIAAFVQHARALDPPAVLDAGCGTGRLVATLQAGGLEVTGVDLSPGMLDVARSVHPEVRFRVAGLARLPFDAEAFAGVLAWYSLIHVPPEDLPGPLTEIARVLRPGGFFLTGFQIGSGHRIVRHPSGGVEDYEAYLWTPDGMAGALRRAGLEPVARCARTVEPDSFDGGYDQGFVLARRAPPSGPRRPG